MTDASSAEFATEKLLYQPRGSATAFVHTTIACRKERGSTVGDYIAFFGRQFVPGRSWTKQELRPRTRGLGGLRARLALGDEASAGLLITGWPEAEAICGLLGFGQNAGDVRWERFYPIMERLTVSHAWRRADKAVRSTFERETA